ncbi:MAG: hypothetical protein ABIO86_13510 [Sphingomonas sp.]
MSYFDPTTWRALTKHEMPAHWKKMGDRLPSGEKSDGGDVRRGKPKKKKKPSNLDQILVVQERISPFDIYCYLHARFGAPNGMQTILRADDSDNMFHWDYNLKVGDKSLYFVGATQETHIWVDEHFTDRQWIEFLEAIKADFARVGKEKSAFVKTLEKWFIFPNQFLSTADECAVFYENIKKALIGMEKLSGKANVRILDEDYKVILTKQAKLVKDISSSCIILGMLTPVMFESFIGLLIAILVKPDFKKNKRAYDAFIRGPLDVKIYDLHVRCRGFRKPIAPENKVMARYWSVVNRRNDVIHGNVDPIKNAVDTVYFNKKVPLFLAGGDRARTYWEGVVKQYDPERVIADYHAAHELIYEIIGHLIPPMQETVKSLMSDIQPGYDEKRGIYGKLFPNHLASFAMEGLRFDGDLVDPKGKTIAVA